MLATDQWHPIWYFASIINSSTSQINLFYNPPTVYRMNENPHRKQRIGKIVRNSDNKLSSSEIHLNMENNENSKSNLNTETGSKGETANEPTVATQREMKEQIAQLQSETRQMKSLLPKLAQRVDPQLEKGNTYRAAPTRPRERIDSLFLKFAIAVDWNKKITEYMNWTFASRKLNFNRACKPFHWKQKKPR